ncbi:MAG: recombinase RecA [Clostridiales bacterium]|nr:recombinase RecA [Clostridiales bacterium]
MSKERLEALNQAVKRIGQKFGDRAVMRWGEKIVDTSVDVVPTGCLGLDLALGIGGIPRGRIIEIYGPESSGKTTLTLHIVAEMQRMKGVCAFIDAEHALDPVYAKKLGVNIDDLYISQPDSGEQGLDIAEEMVRSGAVDLIVIDSVAALVPRAEIDGEMGQATMGVQARLMSQALRKLTSRCGIFGTTIIFTNQLRANITSYGGGETTTGGRALKFYASMRLDIRKESGDTGVIKSGDRQIGNRVRVKVAKNKLAPPFKSVVVDVIFGEGISYEGDMLDVGVDQEIVNKSGSWYSYNDYRLGQGRDAAKKFLKENPTVCEEIENAVRAKNGMKTLTEIRNVSPRELVVYEVSKSGKNKGKAKPSKQSPAQDGAAGTAEANEAGGGYYDNGDDE